jgi:hypothetical protein
MYRLVEKEKIAGEGRGPVQDQGEVQELGSFV